MREAREREQKKIGRRGAVMQGFDSLAAFEMLVIKHIANGAPNANKKYTPAAGGGGGARSVRVGCAVGVDFFKQIKCLKYNDRTRCCIHDIFDLFKIQHQ